MAHKMTKVSPFLFVFQSQVFMCGDQDQDSDEMDTDNDIFTLPAKEKKSYEVDYDSLGQQSVERHIAREVDHISGIFGVDVSRFPP